MKHYGMPIKTNSITLTNRVLKVLEKLCNENHVLGGSIALFLYGIKLGREFKDIDLIYSGSFHREEYPFYSYIDDTIREPQLSEGGDYMFFINYKKVQCEILQGDTSKYCNIMYKGYLLKVQTLSVIIGKKYEYQLKGYAKHVNDLTLIKDALNLGDIKHINYAKNKSFKETDSYTEDDLPF